MYWRNNEQTGHNDHQESFILCVRVCVYEREVCVSLGTYCSTYISAQPKVRKRKTKQVNRSWNLFEVKRCEDKNAHSSHTISNKNKNTVLVYVTITFIWYVSTYNYTSIYISIPFISYPLILVGISKWNILEIAMHTRDILYWKSSIWSSLFLLACIE